MACTSVSEAEDKSSILLPSTIIAPVVYWLGLQILNLRKTDRYRSGAPNEKTNQRRYGKVQKGN